MQRSRIGSEHSILTANQAIKSKAPLIGITTHYERETRLVCLGRAYVDAVRLAGGVPILLPLGPDSACMVERLDGLILSGGGDIDPALYNGTPHPTIYNVNPERDRFEIALAQLALEADMPVLGICRGLEVLVIATGGSLVPHLPDEFGEVVVHRAEQLCPAEHKVQIAPESRLASMTGSTEATVVSWHHQAASMIPLEWRVAARAEDGVIEALEHENHRWAIALQWHPELSINDPLQLKILQAFVAAASQRKVEV